MKTIICFLLTVAALVWLGLNWPSTKGSVDALKVECAQRLRADALYGTDSAPTGCESFLRRDRISNALTTAASEGN
jgi:hypothetical protein